MSVVLSVFIIAAVIIGPVESVFANCSEMGGKREDCVKITDCPAVIRLFETMTTSPSNTTRDKLRKLQCGWFQGTLPMVCCLPDATSFVEKSMTGEDKPYSHRNLHLLSKHDCGQSDMDRIIGGSVAKLFEYPWMVLLAYHNGIKSSYECGGSLINEKYVLTAAHCITTYLLGVRIGEHDIKRQSDCIYYLKGKYCAPPVQDFTLQETIKHENYLRQDVRNDIALIRLSGTVDLNNRNAKPVCLPIYTALQNVQLEGQSVYVVGWGITEKVKPSDLMMKVSLKVITNDDCIDKYNMYNQLADASLHINDNKLCAGEEGKDSCRGDSGGPMIFPALYQNRVRYIQYGIVSYGSQKCGSETPGVYTKITRYLDWILDNMKP